MLYEIYPTLGSLVLNMQNIESSEGLSVSNVDPCPSGCHFSFACFSVLLSLLGTSKPLWRRDIPWFHCLPQIPQSGMVGSILLGLPCPMKVKLLPLSQKWLVGWLVGPNIWNQETSPTALFLDPALCCFHHLPLRLLLRRSGAYAQCWCTWNMRLDLIRTNWNRTA